ncbi:MAG TPA: hypothetical protein VNJ46_10605, partial [Gaiellaceae bacterium]|nr:hypothetical protein [Gaiellaceae bacterium]
MTGARLRSLVLELRQLAAALRAVGVHGPGAVVVSGLLAEQLARGLGADAEPGALQVGEGTAPPGAGVAVHVLAGEPSEGDRAYVAACDARGVPVVIVQVWPQAERRQPFVLSPFVVECRAGEGFPLGEIAARIAVAAEDAAALAARIPALREAVVRELVRTSVVRSALLALLAAGDRGARAALTLEQARLLARLRV